MRYQVRIAAVILLASTLSVANMSGQGTASFRKQLSEPDELSGASVKVYEHGTAALASAAEDDIVKETVTGYRIRIFFDNSQNARQEALSVKESFDGQFPDIKSYLSYENPAFIVTVGNCLTMEEALILQSQVRRKFNTAFVWRGEIPLKELATRPERPVVEESDDDGELQPLL